MKKVKISEFPVAENVQSNDYFPVVQNAQANPVTRKVTFSGIKSALSDGLGSQIQFPTTGSALGSQVMIGVGGKGFLQNYANLARNISPVLDGSQIKNYQTGTGSAGGYVAFASGVSGTFCMLSIDDLKTILGV